jgi:hypothetical protein
MFGLEKRWISRTAQADQNQNHHPSDLVELQNKDSDQTENVDCQSHSDLDISAKTARLKLFRLIYYLCFQESQNELNVQPSLLLLKI